MSRTPKYTKKVQDRTRYQIKTGKLRLPDVCCFCRKSGCEETHHDHYGTGNKVFRCHKACHVAYHNKTRRGKSAEISAHSTGLRIA